jgi:hypothetical protein
MYNQCTMHMDLALSAFAYAYMYKLGLLICTPGTHGVYQLLGYL